MRYLTTLFICFGLVFIASAQQTSNSGETETIAPNGEKVRPIQSNNVPERILLDSLDRNILPVGTLMRTEEYLLRVEELNENPKKND